MVVFFIACLETRLIEKKLNIFKYKKLLCPERNFFKMISYTCSEIITSKTDVSLSLLQTGFKRVKKKRE